MKTNRLLFGALSACFAASLLAAQTVRADDKPVTLKRTFKEKDVREYKEEVKASLGGADLLITQTTKETVEKVKDNGDVMLKSEGSESKVSFNGMEMAQPSPPPSHSTRDKMGKLLEVKMEMENEDFLSLKMQKLMESITGVLLPKDAVKENDAWETELDNPAVKDKKFKVKTQYQGTDKVDGVELWKIKQTTSPNTDDAGDPVAYEATFWLDPKDGSLVKIEEKVTDLPTANAMIGKISFTRTAKLVKPEKAEKAK